MSEWSSSFEEYYTKVDPGVDRASLSKLVSERSASYQINEKRGLTAEQHQSLLLNRSKQIFREIGGKSAHRISDFTDGQKDKIRKPFSNQKIYMRISANKTFCK